MRTIDHFHNYSSRQQIEDLSSPADRVIGVYNPETNSYDPPQERIHEDLPTVPGTVIVGELSNVPIVDEHHNYRNRQ